MAPSTEDVGQAGLVGDLLSMLEKAAADPASRAMTHLEDPSDGVGRHTNYGEMTSFIRAVAGGFREAGVRSSDTVAILAPSTPENLIAFVAANTVATVFPINPLLSSETTARQFEVAGATACFVYGLHPEMDIRYKAAEAMAFGQSIRLVIEFETSGAPGSPFPPGVATLAWSDLLRSKPLQGPVAQTLGRTAALLEAVFTIHWPGVLQPGVCMRFGAGLER